MHSQHVDAFLVKVDCIWMMETHIALLQRNGDVRHIEFDINGELMRLADLFADETKVPAA